MSPYINDLTISALLTRYPFVKDFLEDHLLPYQGKEHLTLNQLLSYISEETIEDNAINIELFKSSLIEYIDLMKEYFVSSKEEKTSITIFPGNHKNGEKEAFDPITINSGEIIAIVGPTGSGKSRLLADIEWAANNDTPTKRVVYINGKALEPHQRFSSSNKLVAQLSQNMNFVMDMTVYEFLDLHATSRLVNNKEQIIEQIFDKANSLAGETFAKDTPITELSGGQSRALMIADTAILSTSPIILIDEIENAGIDRKLALDLLVSKDKIVLMSTHDPILALMGDKRIVIHNGGIQSIIQSSKDERAILSELERLDHTLMTLRQQLRYGKQISLKEENNA